MPVVQFDGRNGDGQNHGKEHIKCVKVNTLGTAIDGAFDFSRKGFRGPNVFTNQELCSRTPNNGYGCDGPFERVKDHINHGANGIGVDP